MKNLAPSPAGRAGSWWRSFAGWAVALVLLPFLLGNDSCHFSLGLNTPVGDPERGWADPRITGVWVSGDEGKKQPSDFSADVWVFEPYDPRTWLVTVASFTDAGAPAPSPNPASAPASAPLSPASEPATASAPLPDAGPPDVLHIVESLGNERAKPGEVDVFKAWLTTLGGRRFLVLEPRVPPFHTPGLGPYWWLPFRADLQGGRLLLSALDMNTEKLGEATTRAQAEAIIARHAADPKFTELALTLYPVPKAGHDAAAKALGRAFSH